LEKEGQGGFAAVCSNQGVYRSLSAPIFKKRGWVSVSFIGFPNGGLNGMELAEAGSSNLLIARVAASLFVVISLLAGQVTSVRATWARIVVRVAGSWIAASGLFRLGWAVRGG
jgi:hypothetical protein